MNRETAAGLALINGWDNERITNDQRAASCDILLPNPFLGSELLKVIDTLMMRPAIPAHS